MTKTIQPPTLSQKLLLEAVETLMRVPIDSIRGDHLRARFGVVQNDAQQVLNEQWPIDTDTWDTVCQFAALIGRTCPHPPERPDLSRRMILDAALVQAVVTNRGRILRELQASSSVLNTCLDRLHLNNGDEDEEMPYISEVNTQLDDLRDLINQLKPEVA